MSINNPTIRSRVLVLTAAVAVFALSGLAAAAHAWRVAAASKNVLPEVVDAFPAAPLPQRRRPIADFESELITITPHGFEPREIMRPQGRFLLMVDNRSGLSATSLALTREAGARTHEMRVPREEPNWSDVVNLPPGRYLLTESDHSRWVCRITITAP